MLVTGTGGRAEYWTEYAAPTETESGWCS